MIGKNNTQKLLEFFFKYPTREVYLRELSREMKLSISVISEAIKKLGKEKLITIKKGKATTNIKANLENINFIRLKKVYSLESLYMSGIVDFLHKEFRKPQAIICFGSYSRGEDIEKSDIDIAIIGGAEKEVDISKFENVLKRKISIHYIKLDRISGEFKSNLCNGIMLEGAI